MWGAKRRARAAAARRAELDMLREDVKRDILAQVDRRLSLARTDADGRPNVQALNEALRNLPLLTLTAKTLGYELARSLAAALPVRTETAARRVDLPWKLATQADMASDWAAHWCAELRVPVMFSRKLWEYAYLLQALFDAGLLRTGARGLGFGCGEEPIASYLAAQGVAVTVTDLAPAAAAAAGWVATHQHATPDKAFRAELVDRASFDRLVRLEVADMNALPPHLAGYDFCWSVCALEHLGSIERGIAFVERAMATLKPGGVAVHTTEYNLDPDGPTVDHWPTVLFQRAHVEALAERLRTAGHQVSAIDLSPGDGPMDRFIDLPPWGHDMGEAFAGWHAPGAHLKVAVDGFAATCLGLVVRRGG